MFVGNLANIGFYLLNKLSKGLRSGIFEGNFQNDLVVLKHVLIDVANYQLGSVPLEI